ncbi:DUF3870 domain-containing protein [Aneurinibacillus tyrosinisolvens]|uniref:DUF3870 domain-containing protein n=1 Tax=Aneurinibacillus tyrosinisolvens TaxID=1443435 RepID=UPI00063F388B|nr:DUF3870 domain-containing protein [Aneurinibacillus tyrosinisolvens]
MFTGKTYFIAGHAKLPQGMAARSVFDTLTITVEADVKYHVILEASCTLATEHGRHFFGQLLRGCSLQDGVEEMTERILQNYQGKAQNALIAALRDVHSQFLLRKERL